MTGELQSISGAKVHPQFGDVAFQGLPISEVPRFHLSKSGRNPNLTSLVYEAIEPVDKLFRQANCEYTRIVSMWIQSVKECEDEVVQESWLDLANSTQAFDSPAHARRVNQWLYMNSREFNTAHSRSWAALDLSLARSMYDTALVRSSSLGRRE